MINYILKINFQDIKILTSDICFVSGDVNANKLIFEFYDNGKRVNISNCICSIRAKRSDGIIVACSGNIENNTAIFTLENNVYATPGELYMEIALSDASGKYVTTKIIIASVVQGLGEASIEGTDNLSVYVTLLNRVQREVDAVAKLADGANAAAEKYPYIGANGNWFVFDVEQTLFKDTGIPATGPKPEKGVDYWTDGDKAEIVSEVKEELGDIQIDDAMSDTSENAVQNKVVKKYVDETFVRNIEYGEGTPIAFSSQPVDVGKLYFDTTGNTIYICTECSYSTRDALYFMSWNKLLSAGIDKNTMLFWEPNTKYHIGDQVFANISESYNDYVEGIYKQVVLECIAEHTSYDVEELWLFDEDMAAAFAEHWNIKSDYEILATKDGKGNVISEYYASKAEIGDIETALLEIEAMADSLIGGDSE